MAISIPTALQWLEREPGGGAWLRDLPDRVARCAEAWRLRLEEPFPDAWLSLALPGRDAAGRDIVLKLAWPHREAEHEALALAVWEGDGAVQLLAHDPQESALLLERCQPGSPLASLPVDSQLEVVAALLPRLWRRAEAPPFRSLEEEARHWAGGMLPGWERHGRRWPRRLVDAALEAIGTLASTQGEQVLLHQDLHSLNVLRAQREPWLVIDPKALVGEREFSLAPILRGVAQADVSKAVASLDELSAVLGLDRERARWWTVIQTMAWSLESDRDSPPIRLVEALLA